MLIFHCFLKQNGDGQFGAGGIYSDNVDISLFYAKRAKKNDV